MSKWMKVDKQPLPDTDVFQKDLPLGGWLTVLRSIDNGLVHMSISHKVMVDGVQGPGRMPTYDEIKEARFRFCPREATMAQLFPPMEEWVNLHETTVHLWEIRDDAPSITPDDMVTLLTELRDAKDKFSAASTDASLNRETRARYAGNREGIVRAVQAIRDLMIKKGWRHEG